MEFTLYTADCAGNAANCLYPHERQITSPQELAEALAYDQVYAKYKNNYRSIENFLSSNVVPMDCDNSHSDDPADWYTAEKLLEIFYDVQVIIVPSRHHMKPKDGKSARPRWHVFFLVRGYTDAKQYAALKAAIQRMYPFFDDNALDAGRFFYGCPCKAEDILWHEGFGWIDEDLVILPETADLPLSRTSCDSSPFRGASGMLPLKGGGGKAAGFDGEGMPRASPIPEGTRNNTLSHFAGRILIRYGDCDKARVLFAERVAQCDPPLPGDEVKSIWRSAISFARKVQKQEGYVPPVLYVDCKDGWPEPLPLSKSTLPPFPVQALPRPLARYVLAVAESTQTAVDMAGSSSISILSLCQQKKFCIRGKADWIEPLNSFGIVVAPPSERKSAMGHHMLRPVDEHEIDYNRENAAVYETRRMQKHVLERQQKVLEEQVAKGKAKPEELERLAKEIAAFEEVNPLQLYVDDITTEKLVSVIASNHGHAAIISTEGGIFDTLSGTYSKNVNIDVLLKAYSGDTIRVDRIGRPSESVMNPALTILLMAQPNVVSNVLSNPTFRGRGLTARFLYSMPQSTVGSRKYRSEAITDEIYRDYEQLIRNMLEDPYPDSPEVITLSPEADELLEDFANWLEPRLKNDLAEIADWAGKLVGNVLRIAGLLCRAGTYRNHEFLETNEPLVVSGETMANAILLGRYYLSHAQAAFSVLPEDAMCRSAESVLQKIRENKLTHFNRRDAMRMCRAFKTVNSIQPVLDFLEDYGYIAQQPQKYNGAGRQPLPQYAVNPWVTQG